MKKKNYDKHLSVFALITYLVSLSLPGLVMYGKDPGGSLGIFLLSFGWLGPLSGYIAWYANPLFLYANIKLLSTDKIPIASSLFSLIIALDTLRVDKVIKSAAPSHSYVYGYGWGSILWFIAILVTFVAVTIRVSKNIEENKSHFTGFTFFSVALLVAFLGVTIVFIIKDRSTPSNSDNEYLSYAAFKRGEVCRLPDVDVENVIHLQGPLLVKNLGERYIGLASVRKLLAWGVPIVRKDGYDYRYLDSGNSKFISFKPAEGNYGATLHVNAKEKYNVSHVEAVLLGSDDKTVVFQGSWKSIKGDRIRGFCPWFKKSSAKFNEPPVSLLQAGLRDSEGNTFESNLKSNKPFDKLPYTKLSLISIEEKTTEKGYGILDVNRDCPIEVGFYSDRKHTIYSYPPLPSSIDKSFDGGKLFYLNNNWIEFSRHNEFALLCQDEYFFLSNGSANIKKNSAYFSIRKLNSNDFSLAWNEIYSVQFPIKTLGYQRGKTLVRPIAISQQDNQFIFDVVVFNLENYSKLRYKITAEK